MAEDNKIRVTDYEHLSKVHDDIVTILNNAQLDIYTALGILETIKQEFFITDEEEE